MWILECDGDSLSNARIWLRPGKKYLFGRTTAATAAGTKGLVIDHKSVSRKHLTLQVHPAAPDAADKTQSTISLRDEGTKFGTTLDGVALRNEQRQLQDRRNHTLKLGNSPSTFCICWHPVVLTFSFTTKETKASKDPLATNRQRLSGLDIQVEQDYLLNTTTHVVAGKRNTAKGLQALINAKYIVDESFIDALEYATSPADLQVEESLCPLESDFDRHWPREIDHLPAKGKEPSERPVGDFLPQKARAEVFQGYTFVFCDSTQFGALHAPIANGGGKALLCHTEPGKTTAEEIVQYVKAAAGEKGLGEFEDGSEGKGVVVVKFRSKGEHAAWAVQLDTQVAQALDHRLIEQSEFLDAILACDASMLRRPLLPADNHTIEDAHAALIAAEQDGNDLATQPDPHSTQVRRQHRPAIVKRFKGFGSDDDDDEDDDDKSVLRAANVAETSESTAGRRNSDEMDIDSQHAPGSRGHKRPAPDDSDGDEFGDMLPAATAMKKRRREEVAAARALDSPTTPDPTDRESSTINSRANNKKKRKQSSFDVQEALRTTRAAAEDEQRREEENGVVDMSDVVKQMTFEQMQRLAVVEDIPLHHAAEINGDSHTSASGRRHGESTRRPASARWDEIWNGRKNFKRFRRRGEPAARRGPRTLIPLEEAKRKEYGIGEDYWLERDDGSDSRNPVQSTSLRHSSSNLGPSSIRRGKGSGRHDTNDASLEHNSSGTDDVMVLGTNESSVSIQDPPSSSSHRVEAVPASLVIDSGPRTTRSQRQTEDQGQMVIDLDAPRTTRRQQQRQQQQTQFSNSRSKSNTKDTTHQDETAATAPANPLATAATRKRKKFAAMATQNNDDDDDDDDVEGNGAPRWFASSQSAAPGGGLGKRTRLR